MLNDRSNSAMACAAAIFCMPARFRCWAWASTIVRPEGAWARSIPKNDMNCIMLFLVGGPSQLDTWDMKPNAPVEIRGPYKPIKTNVPGIEISENLSAHGEACGQIRAHPQRVSHGRRRARHRPPDDADRPAVSGRHRISAHRLRAVEAEGPEGRRAAARAAAAPDRQHRRQHAARPERRISWARAYDPFVLNADPSDPNFKVPDMLPPDYLGALRVDRRAQLARDGGPHGQQVRNFAGCAAARCHVPPGLHADVVAESARGVRTARASRKTSGRSTA